ncbi:MAG: hypothetical protein LBK25_07895 [Treponema sp.]|jgi:hypothetical protein|nr:hypothetical protein [Treponema sp.]
MKRLFSFGLILVLGSSSLVFAQEREERRRGFYMDVGLGFGGASYFNGDTKAITDHFKETTDTRVTADFQFLTIGWALMQDLYLVGTISGIGDIYVDTQNNMIPMIAIETYGIGARYYPLPSKKYLQLGLDLGLSQMSILYDQNNQYITENSDVGFSGKLSAACDFDTTMTGFTALLGGALTMNIIENDTSLSYALFFKVAFK